ncbi:hypothetical protein KR093_000254, partial [Drosophila rubida]
GQANKVSSKLDFDEADNNNNNNQTGVPVIIGQGQGQGQQGNGGSGSGSGGYDQGTGRAGSSGTGSGGGSGSGSGNSASGSSGNRPKIHGVRVTVDTGDGQQQTKAESKESVEITDLGKHKKRVGIHTDITFEITAEADANETSSAQQRSDGEKEDASVPIFKGRASSSSSRGDSKHRSRDPYDPKSQWNPNYSSEHRGLDVANRAGSRSNSGGYYPQYYPQHVYTSDGADAGGIYRNGETWTHYVPVWTTERSPHEQSQLQRRPTWKPCYCMSSYGTDYRRRRASKTSKGIKAPASRGGVVKSEVLKVNNKLEQPFS